MQCMPSSCLYTMCSSEVRREWWQKQADRLNLIQAGLSFANAMPAESTTQSPVAASYPPPSHQQQHVKLEKTRNGNGNVQSSSIARKDVDAEDPKKHTGDTDKKPSKTHEWLKERTKLPDWIAGRYKFWKVSMVFPTK